MARNSVGLSGSMTHAGGIQPSASFFRPSRPSHFSRPSSPSSQTDIPLSPLSAHHHEHDFAESIHENDSMHEHDSEAQFITLKRIKQSREPLLPSPPLHSPSTTSRTRHSGAGAPASRLVRNSVDRVLSIGISFDSVRKSTKVGDEESQHHHHHHHQRKHLQRDSVLSSASPPSPSPSLSRSPSPSENPLSFNPTPPSINPPLCAVPRIDPSTGRPYRRWQLHPSRNRFFLDGRVLTGGDSPWAFIASLILVFGIATNWFISAGVWWWMNMSPAVTIIVGYLSLLTISTMLTTAMTDPGMLPRELDPDPPHYTIQTKNGPERVPMPRDLKVRSDVVRVKYCPTCRTYRPPRSSHCKMCDNCVDGCDHHCQWVNNCIGKRNYTTFFALLMSATITLIFIITTSGLHLYFLTTRTHTSFRGVLQSSQGISSAVTFSLSISVIWPVAALLSYHMRLLLLNVTTIEQIRNSTHKSLEPTEPALPNPFSHGTWRRNVVAVLCRPAGYSWLDTRGVVVDDKRGVNPGMMVVNVESQATGQ